MSRSLESLIGEAAHGRVGQVQRAARTLDQLAEDALSSGRMIKHARAAGWTGGAAEAFRGAVDDELFSNLKKLADGCRAAADALGPYAGVLDEVQSEGRRLLQRLDALDEQVRDAEQVAAARSAEAQTAQSLAGLAADSVQHARLQESAANASRAAGAATASAGAARQAIVKAEQQAQALRERHERAARQASQGLSHAAHMSLRDGRFDGLLDFGGDMATVGADVLDWVGDNSGKVAIGALALAAGCVVVLTAPVSVPAAAAAAAAATLPAALGLAGRAGAISAVSGAGAAGLKTVDPTDTRTVDERNNDYIKAALGLSLAGAGKVAGPRIQQAAPKVKALQPVDKQLRRAVSTPGKRVYIHEPRRKLLGDMYWEYPSTIVDKAGGAAVDARPERQPEPAKRPAVPCRPDAVNGLFAPRQPTAPSPLGPVQVSRITLPAPMLVDACAR